MRLKHEVRNLGCFTSIPQATRISEIDEFNPTLIYKNKRVILPNYNYDVAKTMPIIFYCGLYELSLTVTLTYRIY